MHCRQRPAPRGYCHDSSTVVEIEVVVPQIIVAPAAAVPAPGLVIAITPRDQRWLRRRTKHLDLGFLFSVLGHEPIETCGVAPGQAYAAVRDGAPERMDRIRAVDGSAAMKEDRVRHRRVIVFARVPVLRHPDRAERSFWRGVFGAAGRYLPRV